MEVQSFPGRIKHAWNVFTGKQTRPPMEYGVISTSSMPDKRRPLFGDRTIISSIYTQLSMDVAAVAISHILTDDQGRYSSAAPSGLNYCLTQEANIDQAATAFRQDLASVLFSEGVAAVVAVERSSNPDLTTGTDIRELRVGTIVAWFPDYVSVSVYNVKTMTRQVISLPKAQVAIIQNPMYDVMNGTNSTLQRLNRKLALLDAIDEQSGSGRLDLIIQLPYVIKSEAKRKLAEERRQDIELQLKGSQYGIAYTDGTERITQLNRPAENNMLAQIEYLTKQLFAQLGMSEAVFNGTASEVEMLNYTNRTIAPVVKAITEGIERAFLTKTARTQGHRIRAFKDLFALVPLSAIADMADKLTRNEVLTSNEVRGIIGFAPVDDKRADELMNKNINPGGTTDAQA